MKRGLFLQDTPAGPGTAGVLRALAAFVLLNTLWTFENRWPGFGVLYMPRLSFELCLAVAALAWWVNRRGVPGPRALTALALVFVAGVAVRYAQVTAPAVMGRPVHLYWDGRHTAEVLRVVLDGWPLWRVLAAGVVLLIGAGLLVALVRSALLALATGLRARGAEPWLLGAVGALALSFAAYVPDVRDTRWFFSLPMTPTVLDQARLVARVLQPDEADAVLGVSPAFDTGLAALRDEQGPVDLVLLFAESYGAVSLDRPDWRAALDPARERLQQAIASSGRTVVSARVRAATFGGASWLSHASVLAGLDTADPAHHPLLMASDRPTLVRHFARHGYRTVGWMPGIKKPWPEGAFYGFDRLADDPRIGYTGPDLGYWRIPDHAAMDALMAQELATTDAPRPPVFAVFPTVSTHAPFHPLPALDAPPGTPDRTLPDGADASARYLHALRYQFDWLARALAHPAARRLVLVVVGDHQPPQVTPRGAPWDVPVHVIGGPPGLDRRLTALGFVPGLLPPDDRLTDMPGLTRLLLQAFDGHAPLDLDSAGHDAADTTAPAAAPPVS